TIQIFTTKTTIAPFATFLGAGISTTRFQKTSKLSFLPVVTVL
ncbi:outer membrane receptor domain protein, partial [Vibrio harveyi]